ncbi:Protein ABC1-like protein [Cladobotryum mycophilum]|uniref:Protein ABC1-like protein n=1 Tax=Cladobotryum mycophilum TaxID=491253 RepID=A0ABR0SN68_9HYPO
MGLVDLVIDLTAVLNASRSVASKHVALRGRQLDVYSKSSSVAAILRNRASQRRPETVQTGTGGADASEPAKRKDGVDTTKETGSEPVAPADQDAPASPTSEVKLKGRIPGSLLTGDRILSSKIDVPPTAATKKDPSEELDLPPGIDVNIFHTTRGSKILESLRKEKGVDERKTPGSRGQAQKSKEHPLRNWPPPPPVDVDAAPPAREASSLSESKTDIERVETSQEKPPEPATPTVSEPTATEFTESEPVSNVLSDTIKTLEPKAEVVNEPVQPVVLSPGTPAYQLRESKVPATRFSRLMNYGGLAAGMLGGAVTESVSRAFGGGGEGSVLLSGKNMERLVAKLSQMRGAALKLGQMMSFQDSKMLPGPIQEVLQRVQDRADYMPAWQRDRVLTSNLGADWRDLFSEFEEKPIAAASIGQVHKAVLKSNGKRVAVKIQFPGVADSINSDLDNLGVLLTATKLLPKGLYLNKTIDNARLELGWECDYARELECAKRYKELLQGEEDIFVAPDVYPEASGKQVLTMDFLDGIGVTRVTSFSQEQRDWIGTNLLRLCLREITEFKFMQTDPNWTNFLYNAENNKLELLDFGASREYPEEFVSQYIKLLDAASRADKAGVKKFSEDLGYLTGHESKIMLDAHLKSILTLAEPFLESAPEVYDFKDQTITERVKVLIPVMLHERLTPPPEETYSLHRKLSGAFLLCARLESKVPCRQLFVDSVAKSGYMKSA